MHSSDSVVSSWSNAFVTKTSFLDYEDFDASTTMHYIPRGGGCSFGDSAFLSHGLTIESRALKHIDLDKEKGICRCGAGTTMGELQLFLMMQDMYFPIFGGTQWATIGGAIASDIHGKNHHSAGSFGNHLATISVITPLSSLVECSSTTYPELFAATIGGMGLTGFIYEARLKVEPSPGRAVKQTRTMFTSYEDMFKQFQISHDFQYASIFIQESRLHGFHFSADFIDVLPPEPAFAMDLPWMPAIPVVNNHTIRIAGKFARLGKETKVSIHNIFSYNYGGFHQILRQFNRLLHRSGIIEYHYNLPYKAFTQSLALLDTLADRYHVMLTHMVIKKLGNAKPLGILSFPRDGFAINFHIIKTGNFSIFLDALTVELNNLEARYYLAKDACLSAEQYRQSNSRLTEWQQIVEHWDPNHQLKSDLSTRLNLKPWSSKKA